jgi:hypothetical protein
MFGRVIAFTVVAASTMCCESGDGPPANGGAAERSESPSPQQLGGDAVPVPTKLSDLPVLERGLWAFNSSGSVEQRCIAPMDTLREMVAASGCRPGTWHELDEATYRLELACGGGKEGATVGFDIELLNPAPDRVYWSVRDRTPEHAIVGDVGATRLADCTDAEIQAEAEEQARLLNLGTSVDREDRGSCEVVDELGCSDLSAVVGSAVLADIPGLVLSLGTHQMFAGACVQHDYCYRFGATTYHYSRAQCDEMFQADMHRYCDRTVLSWACKRFADAYYSAVDQLGSSSYHTSSECCLYNYARNHPGCPPCDTPTCENLSVRCGDVNHKCGGLISCGNCEAGFVCRNHRCIKTHNPDAPCSPSCTRPYQCCEGRCMKSCM